MICAFLAFTVSLQTGLLFPESELARSYYFGDGLGVNCTLKLGANHQFQFTWTGCMGVYDTNSGVWKVDGDVLRLSPEKPNRREGFQGMGTSFVPIKWGEKLYLPEESATPGFCANRGGGFDTFESGERTRLISGLPKGKPLIPARYMDYFLHGAVRAHVSRVLANGRVALDKGSADRVKPGMLMAVDAFDRKFLVVESTSAHASLARPFYVWNSSSRVKLHEMYTTGEGFSDVPGAGFQRFDQPPLRHGANKKVSRKGKS